jgi:hypothetical protein
MKQLKYKEQKRNVYVIYKDDKYKNDALEFINYLEKQRGLELPHETHHHIVGGYLGYPKMDIDYFVNRLL